MIILIYEVTNEFLKINETKGTIQNTSAINTVEVSDSAAQNSGFFLYPLSKISFNEPAIYLRCVENNASAYVRVVSFVVDSGGSVGGGSSSSSSDSSVASDEEIDDLLDDIFG